MTEFKKKLEKPRHTYVDAAEASHIYLLPNSLTAGNLFFGFLDFWFGIWIFYRRVARAAAVSGGMEHEEQKDPVA